MARITAAGGPHARRHRVLAVPAALAAALLLVGLGLAGPASASPAARAALAAPTGGHASISNAHPQPGETITVRASDLQPGKPAVLDYLPDGVRFGVVTVRADGTIEEQVRIPANSYDGPKQIVVTSFDSTGRFTYLANDLTIAGPPATVDLSDDTLVPGQTVRFEGDRWFAGSQYLIVLFPEQVVVASGTIPSDRTLSVSARMPSDLRNGKHGFLVGGRAAGGKAAFFKLFATVSGGVGAVPAGDVFAGSDQFTTTTSSSTTSTSSSTSTTLPRLAGGDLDGGGGGFGWLLVVLIGLVVLAVLILTWFSTSDGRTWLRKRRERIEARRRERMRRRAIP